MENTRRVLHLIRIDRSYKGWIGKPCKPKRRKERHTIVKYEGLNAWEREKGMYHRVVIVS